MAHPLAFQTIPRSLSLSFFRHRTLSRRKGFKSRAPSSYNAIAAGGRLKRLHCTAEHTCSSATRPSRIAAGGVGTGIGEGDAEDSVAADREYHVCIEVL